MKDIRKHYTDKAAKDWGKWRDKQVAGAFNPAPKIEADKEPAPIKITFIKDRKAVGTFYQQLGLEVPIPVPPCDSVLIETKKGWG